MTAHGLQVLRIEPDHRGVLADGLEIAGDARLADALAGSDGRIRDVTVLERFPPVYVVTFADGETRRYPSRRPPLMARACPPGRRSAGPHFRRLPRPAPPCDRRAPPPTPHDIQPGDPQSQGV